MAADTVSTDSPFFAARALVGQGRLAEAVAGAVDWAKSEPKNTDTLHLVGVLLAEAELRQRKSVAGDFDFDPAWSLSQELGLPISDTGDAIADLSVAYLAEAVKLGAGNGARVDLAMGCMMTGRTSEAAELLNVCAEFEPDDFRVWTSLASIHDAEAELETAEAHRLKALALLLAEEADNAAATPAIVPAVVEAAAEMARQSVKNGAPNQAEYILNAIAAAHPPTLASHLARIEIALAREDRNSAALLAIQAGLMDPTSEAARSHLSTLLFDTADGGGVLGRRMKALIVAPEDPKVARALGVTLRRAGRSAEAATAFHRAVDLDPEDGESWRNLAALLRDEGHADVALEFAKRALELKPFDPWFHAQHGNILTLLGRFDDAITAYDRALGLRPAAPKIRRALARCYQAAGRHHDAAIAFRSAFEENTEDNSSLVGLAESLAADGDQGGALTWYRRVVERLPEAATHRRALRELLLARGYWGAAREFLGTEAGGDVPRWRGGALQGGTVGFISAADDPLDATLAGLYAAMHLADKGTHVVCICSHGLIELIEDPPSRLLLAAPDSEAAARVMHPDHVAVVAPLADAVLLVADLPLPMTPWLGSSTDSTAAADEPRVAYVRVPGRRRDPLSLHRLRDSIRDGLDATAEYLDPLRNISDTISRLQNFDLVITDHQPTAMMCATMGLPSVVLLPEVGSWWWGPSSGVSPWLATQTCIRVRSDSEPQQVVAAVIAAVIEESESPPRQAIFREADEEQDLREAFDRLAPHLAGACSLDDAERLTGGSRNRVYRVTSRRGHRVIRMGRFPPPRPGFFAKEIGNMRIAAAAGLAPRSYFAEPLDGTMVLEFVDGDVMNTQSLNRVDNAVAAARTYRSLHRLSGFRDKFDILEKVERNCTALRQARDQNYLREESAIDLMTRTISLLQKHGVPARATHNDPLTRNLVLRDGRIVLVDWECSGRGDPHWEVAAMAAQVDMNDETWDAYVEAYFGTADHPSACRVPLYAAVCRYYWWTDALLAHGKSPDDAALAGKAERIFQRWRKLTEAERFWQGTVAAETYTWSPADALGPGD